MIPFSQLLRAELLRLRSTRLLPTLLLLGVGLLVVSGIGLAQQTAAGQAPGTADDATLLIVRNGFSLSLFSALAGALAVGGQLATGEGARAWLAARSWRRLLGAQAICAGLVGLAFGLLAAGVSVGTAALALPANDLTFSLGAGATQAIAGVMGVVFAGALWGAAIGALLVRPMAAAGVLVVQLLVLEPALIRLWDLPSKFLFGNAMGAVYGDQQDYALLAPLVGVVVLVAWCAAAAIAAVARRERTDVPMGEATS